VYDDLRYHQAYRMFIGLDHGTAWSPMQCVRLLQACAPRCCAAASTKRWPVCRSTCSSRHVHRLRAPAQAHAQRIAGGCLSY
jgi:hypothetical protein